MSSIYFLADGDAQALRLATDFEDLLRAGPVPAHDMITVPHLTSLADRAEGVPVTVDLSVIRQIWPNMPEDPERDLSWMAEPVIERIADPLRDRVAGIRAGRVPEVVEAWTAELSGAVSDGFCGQLAADLIQLVQSGCDRQLGPYNWYELGVVTYCTATHHQVAQVLVEDQHSRPGDLIDPLGDQHADLPSAPRAEGARRTAQPPALSGHRHRRTSTAERPTATSAALPARRDRWTNFAVSTCIPAAARRAAARGGTVGSLAAPAMSSAVPPRSVVPD